MAGPGHSQKLQGSLTSSMSVKMDDHVHFKPNIHLLSNKSQQNPNVYSAFSGQSHGHQRQHHQHHHSSFNPPSLFSNTIRHPSDNLSSAGIRIDEDGGNPSGLSFGSTQDIAANLGSGYRGSNTHHPHAPPPQIFNASLSTNLLSSGDHSHNSYSSHPHEKQHDHGHTHSHTGNIGNHSSQGYNSGLGLGSTLHICSSSGGPNAQSSTNNQYSQSNVPYSHANIHYSQTSSVGNPFSHSTSSLQYSTSQSSYSHTSSGGYQNSGSMVQIDNQHSPTAQQPTYVLLQTANDGESGSQPQVFLAMQTPNMSGQDPQQPPYITLQPVNVDGSELSGNTMVQDGVSLQQAVIGNSNDISSETTKQMGSSDSGQVVLSIPGQQALIPSSTNNGSLVTYLQPLGVSNMEQGQVIMASSDLQGNLTLHNVGGLNSTKRNIISNRQSSQVGLNTPRRRLSQDPRSCEQCGRSFKYPSDLKKHLQIHTDIKKFACDDCPRTFRRLHQLNVHRRIHTGEKPYVCNRCGAQFRHDSTLTMHIRTRHDHLKPFTCDGCSKKFGRMSHLRKHQRNVCGRGGSRGSLAQCKYCDATFPKKTDLKAHFNECEKKPDRVEKELLSPTIHVCDTCGKEFSRLYDFKRHQLSHSDEKPYGCPQCGKMFKERSSLNKHVKRMHCSEGDGTIPIDDDSIIPGDEDEDELSGDEHEDTIVTLSVNDDPSVTSSVTAQALAQAGIITSSDGVLTANGQTISATEILNFPEVAEALGINSGAHATVLDSDGNSTMIAITQPGNLETSEVSMDMEQNIIQESNVIVSEGSENNAEQYIPSTEPLPISATVPVGTDNIDSNDELHVVYNHESNETTMYNHTSTGVYAATSLGSSMVFKQEDDSQPQFVKHEDVADHVKAEQAAAHDLSPEEGEHVSDLLDTRNDILEDDVTELDSV